MVSSDCQPDRNNPIIRAGLNAVPYFFCSELTFHTLVCGVKEPAAPRNQKSSVSPFLPMGGGSF